MSDIRKREEIIEVSDDYSKKGEIKFTNQTMKAVPLVDTPVEINLNFTMSREQKAELEAQVRELIGKFAI